MNSSKLFLLIANKVFPFLALPFLVWYWHRLGGPIFALLVLGLPLLFGYLAPGIGTNLLKMWRFRDSWTLGNYFIHHGFIYSATLGAVIVVAFVPPADNDWQTLLLNILRGAGLLGFVGWTHDTIAIREGVMEVYNDAWKRGAPAEVIAAQYAPLCFSLLGAVYAGTVSLGYQSLVLEQNPSSLWWLFPLGLALMSAAISLPFLGWIREVLQNKRA
ncbi:MAG: hypothetical protein AB1750_14150 [Chloroflexota bacterium]